MKFTQKGNGPKNFVCENGCTTYYYQPNSIKKLMKMVEFRPDAKLLNEKHYDQDGKGMITKVFDLADGGKFLDSFDHETRQWLNLSA